MGGYELEFARGMAEVPRGEWDSLLGPGDFPLLSWGYLALLEASGSISPETGWTPAHALLRRDGELVAAAPFYAKAHSWGEYVFDFEFAAAAERLGARWYPKLVGMVPATPAPAWRPLALAGEDRDSLSRALIEAVVGAARESGLGGIHLLWPEPGAAALLRGLRGPGRGRSPRPAFAEWGHQAFLWTDAGYGDFAGYLDSFSKNMRRNVRRERESVAAAGVEARVIGAREAAATPGLLEAMADFYDAHNDKFGPMAARFLERDFFLRLPEFLPEGWAIAAAYGGGGAHGGADDDSALGEIDTRPTALAFFLEGRDRLYGRFWGARLEVPGLHFELCYYLPIEYALGKGIGSFDPGMGSPHKARRGFRSIAAPSFHAAFDRRAAALAERYMPLLSAEAEAEIAALNDELPFKREPGARSPGGPPGGAQAGESTL